jgi:hypothetical protein
VTRSTGSPAESPSGPPRARLRREVVRLVWWGKAHSYLDLANGPESCVLLLGSARSGTTWLGELIDRHHDHRVLFEPFRAGAVHGMEAFDGIRYLPPHAEDARYVEPLRRVLSGQVRNGWVDHTNRARLPRRRLLKEVRVNCLSPWLAARFPQSPLILLVRHPLSVVASRTDLGWRDSVDSFLGDRKLMALLSTGQQQILRDLEGPFDSAVGQWAVETWVPLRHLGASQVRVVLYEDLLRRPRGIGEQVLDWVGQRPDEKFMQVVDRPSRTSRPAGVPSLSRGGPGRFDADERKRARTILEAFGLDSLYDVDEPAPHVRALAHWGHVVL